MHSLHSECCRRRPRFGAPPPGRGWSPGSQSPPASSTTSTCSTATSPRSAPSIRGRDAQISGISRAPPVTPTELVNKLPLLSLCVCNPTCSLWGAARQAVDCPYGPRSPLVGCHSPGRRSQLCRIRCRCGSWHRTHGGVLHLLLPRLCPRRGGCRQPGPVHRDRPAAADLVRRGAARAEPDRGGEQHRTERPGDQRRVSVGQPISGDARRHRGDAADRWAPPLPAAAAHDRSCADLGAAPCAAGAPHRPSPARSRRVGAVPAAASGAGQGHLEGRRTGAPSVVATGSHTAAPPLVLVGRAHSASTTDGRPGSAGAPVGTAADHAGTAIGPAADHTAAAARQRRACPPHSAGALPRPVRAAVRVGAAPLEGRQRR